MISRRALGAAGCALSLLLSTNAVGADEPAPTPGAVPQARPLAADPALEAEVMRIAADLRCLVCQNETIAASNADLAVDLRQQVRVQLQAGRSEAQIKDYMVQRYGDFVLYRPPVKPLTWLLWLGPFVLLAGMLVWYVRLLRRRAASAPPPLSAAEHARAQALLAGPGVGTDDAAPARAAERPL
ncbi:MAG: cytochrome c-type biogenesis protein [Rubrivivax sp.]